MARQNHIFRRIRKGSQAEKLADVLIERPASSEARSISTVGAMASAGMGLTVQCTDCGHEESVAPTAMSRRFGARTPLVDVRPACARCGCEKTSTLPS